MKYVGDESNLNTAGKVSASDKDGQYMIGVSGNYDSAERYKYKSGEIVPVLIHIELTLKWMLITKKFILTVLRENQATYGFHTRTFYDLDTVPKRYSKQLQWLKLAFYNKYRGISPNTEIYQLKGDVKDLTFNTSLKRRKDYEH